jgi:polyisoprenoid-binding protein YceI
VIDRKPDRRASRRKNFLESAARMLSRIELEEKMKNKITQFVLAAALAAGFAAPASAQNSNWKLNSDHSTGRLSLSSTADPNATYEAGIARVKGSVNLDASSLANSKFDFTIYPAGQNPDTIKDDGTLDSSEFSNAARATLITFRSKDVKLTGDGRLAVTGDLTISRLERPVTLTYSEAYSGPDYGEAEVHTATREVTFIFDSAVAAAAKAGRNRKLNLAATADIKTEDFPGLFEAVTNADWPAVVEDKDCQMPATIGEDYQGASCTGAPVAISSHTSVAQAIGDDYPALDLATPRVRDNVSIALNLELTRDASAATASGN